MYDNLRKVMDLDDLLFESRNRDYGAYQLRKKYNSVVIGGILVATLLVSSAVILPFLFTSREERIITGRGNYVNVSMQNLEPPPEQIIIPAAPPPPEASRAQEVVKYVPPVVVDTVLSTEPTQPTNDQILSQETADQLIASSSGTGEDLSGTNGDASDVPFYLVEVMPSFKGGDINKFRDWVQKRTNYPQEAIDRKISGKVYLTFIIETDGAVSNVTIVKGVDPLIDDEALKAIRESPKWSPGLQRGQPVRVRYSMSLNFAF